MKQETRAAALEWSLAQMPREACGVVIIERGREIFVACKNLSEYNDAFLLDPIDYAAAEDRGEIVRIIHSHCYIGPKPSHVDLVSCEATRLPWSIVSVPNGVWHDFEPSGFRAPLVGRQWAHGTLDCYSLIRDYYMEVLKIEIPDFDREPTWWRKGGNLYLENFESAGFRSLPISEIQPHDVVLMQILSNVPNHGAIYLGDERILHHMNRRLSCREIWGGYYKKHTSKVLRYA